MRYEILPHTADMGFRAYGSTLAELVETAGAALAGMILDTSRVKARQTVRIEVRGAGFPETLVNWLNEVLYQVDARGLALSDFRVAVVSDDEIQATAGAEPRDHLRHPPRLVVKAVTYHQLDVRETGDGWQADIYLDI